ncbi:ATP-binding protein [Cytobacillus oceanisediminis]|nr:ATP-binding protein [Cytobacillus oceanisediminis]
MQRKISIIVSILVCAFTLISIIRESGLNWGNHSTVSKGQMHLTSSENLMELNGEWEFYPNKLIDPADLEKSNRKPIFLKVPMKWDSLYSYKDHLKIEAGTYRLTITVPEGGMYGFRAESIRQSSRVYINGEKAGGIGNPSINKKEYEFREGPFLFFGKSKDKQMEVIIHAANRASPNGGIVKPILFGEADQIVLQAAQEKQTEGFITAGYLILSLLILFQYFQQRHAKNELYFAAFCFSQCIYISTQKEKLIYLFYPDISSKVLLSLQLGFIHLSVLFFLWFAHSTFKKQSSIKITKWMSILLIIKIAYVSITPLLFWFYSLIPMIFMQVSLIGLLGSVYIYILFILFRAYREKVSGCEYILTAAISFTCYGAALGIELLLQIDIGRIPLFLFLIMTISLSLYIGYLRQLSFIMIDNLSKDLLVQDQLKNEFLIKTSDKLKEPLRTFMWHSQKLMEGKEGPLNKKQLKYILEMQSSGKKIDRLVNNLRHASSSINHSLRLRPVPLDVISEMVLELRDVLKLPNEVKLVDDIPKKMPSVIADSNILKEVIFNVLDNAIRHTASGEIRIRAFRVRECVHIEISDTGQGMDSLYLEKIFETFYQIPDHSKHDGIGIGLSISKQFVHLMKGEIWADSLKGRGTTITIKLPAGKNLIYEDKESLDEVSADLEYLSGSPEKNGNNSKEIVFACADTEYNHHLKDYLISSGYSITITHNGESALEKIEDVMAGMLIIDLNLGNQSGIALCQMIRKRYLLSELPILMIGSTNQIAPILDSMEIGANEYIQKPVDKMELFSKIKSLFAMKDSVSQSIHNELSYYQAQITPHFLYNTMNTIIGLSYQNADRARDALEHLAVYFRSKLDYTKHHSMVSIEEEMELVESYLAIEKIRFGDLLFIDWDIDESIDIMLPSMTIQPLVENAVQHGVSKKKDGGRIKLSIRQKGNKTEIVVEDNGIGMSKEKQNQLYRGYNHRIGFINPYTKVKLIKHATFELISEEGKGTKVIITMPNER